MATDPYRRLNRPATGLQGQQASPYNPNQQVQAQQVPTARAAPPNRSAGSQFTQTAQQAAPQPQQPQANNPWDFSGPGAMEQYWNSVVGSMQNRSMPTNLSAEAYHREFAGGGPRADFGAYYDRAHERGQEKIDRAMAARGMYGSGAALEAGRDFTRDMEAARANREADYALRAIQEQRLGAGQADVTSRGISQDNLAWMMGGGTLANMAQGAHRIRGRDAQADMQNFTNMNLGILGNTYGQMFGQDKQLMDEINQLLLTGRREEAAQKIAELNRLIGAGSAIGGAIGGTPTPPMGGGAPIQPGAPQPFYGSGTGPGGIQDPWNPGRNL